jgi:zinc transport system permease protein
LEFFSDIFTLPFFMRALVVGSLYACMSALVGSFVVVRKEANSVHSIANTLFLGFTLALLFEQPFSLVIPVVLIVLFLFIVFLQKQNIFGHDSIFEIISQVSMALAIIVISQLQGYRVDLVGHLFGNILAISKQDIWFTSVAFIILIITFIFIKRQLFAITFNKDLAKISGIKTEWINAIFVFLLALIVALGIKIVGVVLLSSFLIIPPNIAKMFTSSFKGYLLLACIISVIGTVTGLFLAYFVDAPSGAVIISVFAIIFLVSILYKAFYVSYRPR